MSGVARCGLPTSYLLRNYTSTIGRFDLYIALPRYNVEANRKPKSQLRPYTTYQFLFITLSIHLYLLAQPEECQKNITLL
jgi:hypothetical protein